MIAFHEKHVAEHLTINCCKDAFLFGWDINLRPFLGIPDDNPHSFAGQGFLVFFTTHDIE
jgi:hypothetical protein